MKKYLSILLAVLMLVNILPFSFAVSAADEPTIVISCEDEIVNAGEEFQVTVNLKNNPGLIGALVEIGFDLDVFELVTYYDEDEEMYLPQIEVGAKYSASSCKYITFGPIDEETGFSERCLVQYLRATATATQVRTEEHFYTATFKVKDYAISGDYELNVVGYDPKNMVQYGYFSTNFAIENLTLTVNGVPPCEHRWNDATCTEPATCTLCGAQDGEALGHSYGEGVMTRVPTCVIAGVMTYTCSKCDHSYTETIATVNHSYGEGGSTQNPFCTICGALTAPTIVIEPSVEEVNAGEEFQVTVNLKNNPGLISARVEIGFDPDVFELVTYYDEDEEMYLPQIEVGAKYSAVSCRYISFGPIDEETGFSERCVVDFYRPLATANQVITREHFYTATFKIKEDAPSGTYPLTVKYDPDNFFSIGLEAVAFAAIDGSVTVNASCEHKYDGDCDRDCNECGAIRDAINHTYYDEYDVKCDVCGAIREVDIIHYDHEVLYSVMDTENGNGLAFRFSLAASGLQVVENTKADYTNAMVRYYGQDCKLLVMGAVVTNQFSVGSKESAMNLDNVNGSTVINVPTMYLCDLEADSCAFSTRVINIPDVALDYPIYARPYYVIEVEGQEVTIYSDISATSCREVLDSNS